MLELAFGNESESWELRLVLDVDDSGNEIIEIELVDRCFGENCSGRVDCLNEKDTVIIVKWISQLCPFFQVLCCASHKSIILMIVWSFLLLNIALDITGYHHDYIFDVDFNGQMSSDERRVDILVRCQVQIAGKSIEWMFDMKFCHITLEHNVRL